jgi:hypothetical protein
LHQIPGDLIGHLLRRGGDVGGAQLQIGQQVGPEGHQGALLLRDHALVCEMGGTFLAVPKGLAVLAGMLALGQACLQGGWAGIAIR